MLLGGAGQRFVVFSEWNGLQATRLQAECARLGAACLLAPPAVSADHLLDWCGTQLPGSGCRVLGVDGLGFFVHSDDKADADALLQAIRTGTDPKRLRRRYPDRARFPGRIAIVTGSAQGFGEGIARELAAQGMTLVIADLNATLAEANAASLEEEHGPGAAIALGVDVGREDSVRRMVEDTVLAFGGLDVLVSNAGVLRAGGLEEMTLESFEFVTRVNYTAYFLCAKYAARPMRLQHRFAPDATFDILQINSKSGLEGSNRNFAYAGGKFGGIGLTQSFAKELVEDRIKVNAICPGNYFEGPLWSDPERGLFVQYLRAGKVPGARTLDDVRRFYEAKVPMNRGCHPRDVARAIFYCIEQEYETGQAVPVTGGQNMLK